MPDEKTALDLALEARAAEKEAGETADERSRSVLFFELGGGAFAIEGEFVKGVLPMSEPFFVPGCPPSLEGVILHQGEVESVIDISGTIGRPATARDTSRSILIGQTATMRSGIRVDRVVDVAEILESAIAPAPPAVRDSLRETCSRVVERAGIIVPILDLPVVFSAWERAKA